VKYSTNSRLPRKLLDIVQKFENIPILVIGDLIVDRSISGAVHRISPEAPVPVLEVEGQEETPGGAGNVVCNLRALGSSPSLISIRGDDEAGDLITSDLIKREVKVTGLICLSGRPTITKTRVIAHQQQVIRLDVEKRDGLPKRVTDQLVAEIKEQIKKCRAVIISDYGKGVVSKGLIRAAIREAHRHGLMVIVDPKIEHFQAYKGVDCLTPNSKESVEGMRVLPPKNDEGYVDLGWKIVKKLNCQSLLMTRGEKGMLLFQKERGVKKIETRAQEVFDVTGAGDTVIASFTLARAAGANYYEAAQIANCAAGIVVGKLGTATVSLGELKERIKEFS